MFSYVQLGVSAEMEKQDRNRESNLVNARLFKYTTKDCGKILERLTNQEKTSLEKGGSEIFIKHKKQFEQWKECRNKIVKRVNTSVAEGKADQIDVLRIVTVAEPLPMAEHHGKCDGFCRIGATYLRGTGRT